MSAQQAEVLEVIEYEPAADIHTGRPMRPEYAERGELLMAQWSLEDAA